MPKKTRRFLCQGCRGNNTKGPLIEGVLIMCAYAKERVPVEEYQSGDRFESCRHRKIVAVRILPKLAKRARKLGTADPRILASHQRELEIAEIT